MSDPVLQGEITGEGVISLLADIEERRTSGVLHFESGDLVGDVHLVAGQLALEQPELPDGRDAVEALLELREGTYELLQRLPPLPVSHGDQKARVGSLDVHVPADLMNYCEAAGLTGLLHLELDGRTAEAIYSRGELTDIRVDGTADEDLHDVFGWTQGEFKITAHSIPPTLAVDDLPAIEDISSDFPVEDDDEDPLDREPTIQFHRRRAADTSEIFLRSVEVALTDIISEREKRRGPEARTGPESVIPQARDSAVPGVQKVVRIQATRKRKRQPTVRIVYSSNRNPEDVLGTTRHVAKGLASEGALPIAAPERISEDTVGKKKKRKVRKKPGAQEMAVVGAKKKSSGGAKARSEAADGDPAAAGITGSTGSTRTPHPEPNTLATLGWVAAIFALLLVAVFILARLPPVG